MGGITAEMKRILDIDKILEDREKEKQKSNYWQRIKNDPVKFGHYKEWRKQYVNKKKEKEARTLSPAVVAVPVEKIRENIISQITESVHTLCRSVKYFQGNILFVGKPIARTG